jgi:hypothetical protein
MEEAVNPYGNGAAGSRRGYSCSQGWRQLALWCVKPHCDGAGGQHQQYCSQASLGLSDVASLGFERRGVAGEACRSTNTTRWGLRHIGMHLYGQRFLLPDA